MKMIDSKNNNVYIIAVVAKTLKGNDAKFYLAINRQIMDVSNGFSEHFRVFMESVNLLFISVEVSLFLFYCVYISNNCFIYFLVKTMLFKRCPKASAS